MKTATQELQELLISRIIKKENGHLNDLQEGFNNGLICALEYIEEALEKEKEQIINAYNQADLDGYFQKTYPKYAEEYYNKTYNQKI